VTVIQIYTFTDVEQAQEAAALGVDNIGFVAGKRGGWLTRSTRARRAWR